LKNQIKNLRNWMMKVTISFHFRSWHFKIAVLIKTIPNL